MPDALKLYKAKRNFQITSEPAEGGTPSADAPSFVIQKHWASRLHYDLRLEIDGTMKSWAVPKGPSYDTHDKRMAVHVEDHPISYNDFEGTIPEHQYGAGKVIIWDKGSWAPVGDPRQGYAAGNLKFEMHGHKMHGRWVLVRIKGRGEEKQEPWLLIKENDEYARPASEFSVVDEMPDSVKQLPMPGEAAKLPKKAKSRAAAAKAPSKKTAARRAAARDGAAEKAVAEESAAKPAPGKRARQGAPGAQVDLAGAVEAALPEHLSPELATLVDKPPSSPEEWIFEIKFDGYRMLARLEGGAARLITRNGNDWTAKLPRLRQELERMQLPDGWYDGEIVVHDEHGKPSFSLLQQAFDGSHTSDIPYFLFDVPYLAGYDLRDVPLMARRAALEQVLAGAPSEVVRFSAEFGTGPDELVAAACKLGLEGVIGKRRDSRYVTRRSPEWIKLKCGQRQEFVIGGFTDPQGGRVGIGSLLLGTYDEGEGGGKVLRYAGNVGSGFNGATLRHLREQLDALRTDASPFPPKSVAGRKHYWVKPRLIAEVSFAEWTASGHIRHAVFQGLRADKPAKAITREVAQHVEDMEVDNEVDNEVGKKAHGAKEAVAPAGKLPRDFTVSNADRVIDKVSGSTKLDMIRYYALVGDLMMEHLKNRPVSLVRAPAGVGGELFFQKHSDVTKLPGMRQLPQELDPDHPPMLEVGSVEGLLSIAQWNVIEVHTQNAVGRNYEKPDRMVFDLDPGEGVAWSTMQEAAQLMHAFLDSLGLPSWLKTSGGKGLHVVVPIKPALDWDTVKDFSQAIVKHLASTLPERFAFKSGPKNRVGKIFIDYLRNGRGATTICAWSARVRPGLGISVPLAWDELAGLKASDQWNIKNVHTRLDRGNEPWSDYPKNARSARTLTAAMKQMGFKPGAK